MDGPAKSLRKKHEDMIGSLEASAEEKIAGTRFKLFGDGDYPDATGTPRVEFGRGPGLHRPGRCARAPATDSFGGLYFRTNNEGPYEIPQRWVDLKSALNLETPLDFVSTCDVGGGDYGSPVVNPPANWSALRSTATWRACRIRIFIAMSRLARCMWRSRASRRRWIRPIRLGAAGGAGRVPRC